MKRLITGVLAGVLAATLWGGTAPTAQAQQYNLTPWFYYPYYYFPHNYWPIMSPPWPEPIGTPYRPPPAYMAFPPYKEHGWHYEYWEPKTYYRGSHFLLDVF